MKRLEDDLQNIRREMLRLSSLTNDVLVDIARALEMSSVDLARKAIHADEGIDALRFLLDELLTRALVMHHPMTNDLRSIISAMHACLEYERIGDEVVNIGGALLKLQMASDIPERALLSRMASLCIDMLADATQAYFSGDTQNAYEVCKRDDEVDALYLEVELLCSSGNKGAPCIQAVLIARFFERIADHTTNICEWTVFEETGVHQELN